MTIETFMNVCRKTSLTLMACWLLIGLGKSMVLLYLIVSASLLSFGSLPRATDAKIGHQR